MRSGGLGQKQEDPRESPGMKRRDRFGTRINGIAMREGEDVGKGG